jgi:hypothetical protein
VLDAGSGKPIPGVLVAVVGTDLRVESDERGRFLFESVPAGTRSLLVERIGYAASESTLEIRPGVDVEATIRMGAEAVELPPIEVVTRAPKLTESGFFDRRDKGGSSGHYITRADIERRNASGLTDMLTDVPSVKLFNLGPGRTTLRFNRAVPSAPSPGRRARYALDPPRNALDLRGCEPDTYVDGRLYRNSSGSMTSSGLASETLSNVDDYNAIPIHDIEGIEVYVGTVVPAFVRHTACGAIVIWLRR